MKYWEIIADNLSKAGWGRGCGIVLLLLTQLTGHAQNEFTWKDSSQNTRNLSDLQEILREHQQWTESGGKSGTRADLARADLTQADLTGADLKGADLIGAHLKGAHLNGADLKGANLNGARLIGAYLKGAHLNGAGLDGADLTEADLTGADLIGADHLRDAYLAGAHLNGARLIGVDLSDAYLTGTHLTGAYLGGADLKGAHLGGADLKGADLSGADLSDADLRQADLSGTDFYLARVHGTIFEPQSLPQSRTIAATKNLELLTYKESPDALFQLRKQFKDGGFREQERKITYALKRREAELSWEGTSRKLPDPDAVPWPILSSSDSILANFASFILNKVFFDWTCQYGMSPGRPLILGVVLWFLCSLVYFTCIHTPGEAGLYRIYGQSIHDDPSTQPRVERISPLGTAHSWGPRWLFQFFWRECSLLRSSMFFSLMSAFNIGFRDINFGRWLRLLTRQEFDIKAVGWARVVAGWQSLISVYLIALWVLTYFGRPFD